MLEFSQPRAPGLKPLYDAYSFRVLPLLGRFVAGDEASYRYLAESIRMHPDQETLLEMMQGGGTRGLPLPQPHRRHRRRAPRLPLLTARRMLTATLENLLNRGLPRSPRARQLCAQLAGRSLGIEVRDIARLRVASNGVTLAARARATRPRMPRLSGGPFGLLGLIAGRVRRRRVCSAAPSP